MATGTDGGGVQPFKWTGDTKKDTYGGERKPLPDGYKGRVLQPTKREGMKETTGPQK